MGQVIASINIEDIIKILDEAKDLDEARKKFADLYFQKVGNVSPLVKLIQWSKTGKIHKEK